jgi:hypothetical protein
MTAVSFTHFKGVAESGLELFDDISILKLGPVDSKRLLVVIVIAAVTYHRRASAKVHSHCLVVRRNATSCHPPCLHREFEVSLSYDDVVILELPLRRTLVGMVPRRVPLFPGFAHILVEGSGRAELVLR